MNAKSQILTELKNKPNTRFADIGKAVGVSREYVRQVATMVGISAASRPKRSCIVCGKGIWPGDYGYRQSNCPDCRRKSVGKLTFTCDGCGRMFVRTARSVMVQSKYGQRPRFCSRSCHGLWVGKNGRSNNGGRDN